MALKTTPLPYALVMALFFLVAPNFPFAQALLASMGGLGLGSLRDGLLVFAALYALLFLVFFLTAWRWVTKPVGFFLLLTAAPASSAVLSLNTEFSPLIIRSVFRTDLVEARGVLSLGWLAHFVLLGVLPCLLLRKVEIRYPPLGRHLTHKALAVGATLVAAVALYFPNQLFFNSFADNATNHRLKNMVVPFNYLGALGGLVGEEWDALRSRGGGTPGAPGAGRVRFEASRGPLLAGSGKRTLVIFVLGESARGRSFSLNGYERDTNPRLRRQGVVSFTRFSACATATAQAVPCIFASFGEKGFGYRRAEETDNLLDVASTAGYQVTWYENGMGTQAVTRRVKEVNLGSYYKAERDRILIDRLPTREELLGTGKDHLIVLHQRGSHGPDYAARYTPEFRAFTPDCDSSVLKSCSHEAVVNAYDNSILYTDGNLDDAIEYLKRLEADFNTALLYTSDHGESTGEDGWYMHGLPKALAPEDQVRVPFIAWFSPGLQAAGRLDVECVRKLRDGTYSHDNLFHSTVGLLDIQTPAYDGAQDIFRSCRSAGPAPRP
ncbi:MAG: sulfatase-like hydrolase/transferase [Deltaproteobacteria bacterium]|nr:sulfatase-like hydrolase/transferase [Deltaproteobacteria bacterium]